MPSDKRKLLQDSLQKPKKDTGAQEVSESRRGSPLPSVAALVALSRRRRQDKRAKPGPIGPALFTDVTAKSQIDFVHKSGASPEKHMVETFGSGVAWIDYDNDGFEDLYFVNGAPGAANALYHNNKDGTFKDVTARSRRRRQRRRQGAPTRPVWRSATTTTTATSTSTSPASARTSFTGTTATAPSPT